MGGASLHKLVGQKSPADGKHGENKSFDFGKPQNLIEWYSLGST